MANDIRKAKKYSSALDEVYMHAACTSAIESDKGMMRETANAAEVMVPMLYMDGLADYDRNSGYVKGNVTLQWKTMKYDYERGRKFDVDFLDDEESVNVAFGRLAGEFVRTKTVPEIDAYRFAALSEQAGGVDTGTLTTGAQVVTALRSADSAMFGDSVPMEDRVLFITKRLHDMIKDMDTYKSKDVLSGFSQIIDVPQTRFSTSVKLNDGTTEGEEAGGFEPDGDDINFMIVHRPAVICFTRNVVSKIITPELNQFSDGWLYMYRAYAMTQVYANKASGVYVHHAE